MYAFQPRCEGWQGDLCVHNLNALNTYVRAFILSRMSYWIESKMNLVIVLVMLSLTYIDGFGTYSNIYTYSLNYFKKSPY